MQWGRCQRAAVLGQEQRAWKAQLAALGAFRESLAFEGKPGWGVALPKRRENFSKVGWGLSFGW